MSIVLVIIGLIVGGVLVGRDLIKAAEVRAEITQIDKFNTAVNTFYGKFGYLPGDMQAQTATSLGFTVGSGCDGSSTRRDGNGLIAGTQAFGEPGLFWQDLSSPMAGKLTESVFPNSGGSWIQCPGGGATLALSLTPGTAYIGDNFPLAKLGTFDFLYVYAYAAKNWFGVSAITSTVTSNGNMYSNADIPVGKAYNIDNKIDDGLPTTGNVQAVYINGAWSSGAGLQNRT